MTQQGRLWAVAATAAIAAAGGLVLTFALDGEVGPVSVVASITIAQAVAWAASYWLQPKGEAEIWLLDEAIFVAAALMLPPAGVVLVFAVGVPLGVLIGRARLVHVVFNGAQMAIAAMLGVGAARLIGEFGPTLQVLDVAAALAGACVLILTNEVLLAVLFRVGSGRPITPMVLSSLKFRGGRSAAVAAIGVVAGVAGGTSAWAAVFAVPPLAAMEVVLAEHLLAKRDRERTDGLFKTAIEAHASVQTSEVRDALTKAAARLLRCGDATLDDRPPGDDEWGVRLQLGGDDAQWLIVRDRHSDEDMDEHDVQLLATIAAVGSSALENARLVEEIQHQAVHDTLTGLPNQLLFEDRVNQAVTGARRARERFAVVVLDLDAFKKVNDSLGHNAGNKLLQLVADRLSNTVREVDTVARLGADHFTLLLPDIGTPESAGVMAEKVLDAIRKPLILNGTELFMTASAGIAVYPEDGTRAEHLLRNADTAMHRAKSLGRDQYQIYASGMNELAHLRLARESELHNAVARDQLRVRYQPQIDLRTGRIVGVEALVRWEHPVLGLIGPREFVPLAEESGLIILVDAWVLREAAHQARRWLDDGLPPLRMAVNLSGRHFQTNERLVDTVKEVLAETGLEPSSLELEVTEGMAVGEAEEAARMLQRVRELGVKLAIDDFGTGYSMLGRLQRFPIDRLKIDQSFVREITSAQGEAPIVSAMIALARSLHIDVVAEGVETLEQQTFLRNHGCDHAQGFLFSHPVEADEIARILQSSSVGFNVTAVS
jgi:diguanylate cyclase (GGDEF)-like protein